MASLVFTVKKRTNRHLAVPDDSSVMGERPVSGSDKRLFSPRTCARSLNLKNRNTFYKSVAMYSFKLVYPRKKFPFTPKKVSQNAGYKFTKGFGWVCNSRRSLKPKELIIYQTRESVSSPVQTPRRKLKIRRAAKYF